ncbi:MAG TPA: ScpA family protein [Candidatus Paceibacterota bacterium]|nr:ScpA family protein [Candidatus Paceibacterota bacterium]HRZ34554.1 ScpA family protein [Candidatus Paceibacterota bacterium]
MEALDFKIKTETFEGPLDLLLNLIEKRKLLINDISLAKVTNDYIGYLKIHGEMPMGQNSNFILIAATLLLIKSKSLLPTLELSDEEEQSIGDLEKRLKIYKRLKEVEPQIAEMFFKNPSFPRRQVLSHQIVFAPTKQINLKSLQETISGVLDSLPKFEKVAKAIVNKVLSLEEMIGRLTERVKKSLKLSFKEFSGYHKKNKINIIVSFLAMLELVKEGIIETTQKEGGEDIEIQTREFDTPSYT